MQYSYVLALLWLILPFTASAQGLQGFLSNLTVVISTVFIPFLFGITFLVFVINVVRFFVLQSNNEEGRENARSLITYSVLAFVFLVIFWGTINLLTSSLGFTRISDTGLPCSDYVDGCDNNPNTQTGGGGNSDTGGFGTGTGAGPGSGFGTGDTSAPSGGFPSAPTSPTSPTTAPGQPVAPVVDTSSYPTANSDNTAAVADAAATRQAVETVASDFTDALPSIYDWRTVGVIEEAVAAINDPNATNQERVVAAIRLANNNVMTDNDLARYTAVLNTEQRVNGEPELNLDNLRTTATQPSEYLVNQVAFTQQALLPIIQESHRSWFDFGQVNTSAQEAAQQDLDYIYNPNLTAPQRIAAFDNIVSRGDFSAQDNIPALRNQLINDTNGELFFAGRNPLMVPGQPLNTPNPN